MSLKDAITSLQQGDSNTFKEVISSSLMSKAMDAIEVEKMVAGQKFFDTQEVESDEEL